MRLVPFDKSDYCQLIAEIPDARFLLQWAGPKYVYPLDADQLNGTLAGTIGEKPIHQVFKAIREDISKAVGHIQLVDIDYKTSSCILGRVLIFKKYRGAGFGRAIVEQAVKYAFENLNLLEIRLAVFDFNAPAINTYKRIGFVEFQFKKDARPFKNEKWNVIKMKLDRKHWG